MTHEIGVQTTLTDSEWIKAFLASLDDDTEQTHDTYTFLKNNRFPDDGFDEELQDYQQLCNEKGIEF
ncbi:hypothetical protein V2K54_04615 [Pseudomonas alliivorans]|nr:hypothetical protein [Pseudomonas alliivorans]MEE5172974.1 hypothetical protein [Pseudomonas alliivorans]